MAAPRSFAKMKMNYLECRSLRHAWKHSVTLMEKSNLVRLRFECMRCATTRDDVRARGNGRLQTRSYHHSEAYLVKDLDRGWGGRRMFNRNVQTELVRRYVKKAKGGK